MDFFNQSVLNAIGQKLIIDDQTVSVAEEVTAGLLQLAFAQIDNSLLFYKGGLTVVNLDDAADFLDLKDRATRTCSELIDEMVHTAAIKASAFLSSDWSIAVAGFGSPKRGSGYKVFANYVFSFKGEIVLSNHFEIEDPVQPFEAQLTFARHILEHFNSIINSTEV
ncbi:CinA family protein [Epilithonimonas arachidiradicis]|uniref:Competence-damaged protein n=1 Tax=Epilithonimonas arachidiradicis TaxID=1617282 RepID=A0A420D8M5_9FLAO|nr:CinA family protein [Epilithonimonas arachidiradicis]RKE87179.1 competence-damaged protein [Epilithonimonas arachidiradicis]GGG58908.1 hypothetical protein GCM10007332_20730 [Epilithonimonas arachidiradicis]